ncbi:4-diphosphocytidyl-2-C-methyl-D-erythritol kinase [Jatrophihabitans sp. GAS493]|uniref:4-(cytidine 5'-diphospho)-2-C-methyl-D-erythritol kinase n=1 Tax=Jatrophihabitans sp. GAS493 TaxID=1907575 RepID=UPI000BC03148|nr:4-(cytidine 5'-diphospho)-2-C-methyl-D-erythritol kinase [Jatrophihabitans sp. GAS493]SOD70326.1 4-diphosphocytidyl-2-C-methyl-D-erythritol kinase [Jatrophihabitans sp. GAS493]
MSDAALLSVRVRVPAKINLYLGVGPVRPDGFHEIVTIFHAVDLVDEVLARVAGGLSVSVLGDEAHRVPTDSRNLAWKAAALLAERCELPPQAALEITKSIPVGGGMAGGSADAAAALIACARLWDTGSSRAELVELAGELGSDVAFGLTGGTALGTGRGEVLSPVMTVGTFHWALALADAEISAAAAYRELDRLRADGATGSTPEPAVPEPMLEALRSGDATLLAQHMHNDLEPAALALMPELTTTLAAGREAGALAAIVSGSGPTCAFLAPSGPAAAELAAALGASGTCRSAKVTTGPVLGARVMR